MKLSIDVDGPSLQMVIFLPTFRENLSVPIFRVEESKTRIQNTFGFLNPEDRIDGRKPEVTLLKSVRPANFCELDFPLVSVLCVQFSVTVR